MNWKLLNQDISSNLLEQELNLDPLTAKILAQKGFASLDSARAFLHPDFYRPTLPEHLPNLPHGAARILEGLQRGEQILIWGDMDVDGLCATALLYEGLRRISPTVAQYIPNQHGIKLGILETLVEKHHPALLIACDTGINEHLVADYARQAGIDFIIVDHHQPSDTLPDAFAVINPKLLAPTHPAYVLAGVGVAYLALQYIYHDLKQERFITQYLDLVALGMIADVVPLIDDARYWVQRGLKALHKTERIGLQELAKIAQVDLARITADDVGFEFAPRLNAFGRLDDAAKGFELLTTHDAAQAAVLASLSQQLNQKRRLISRQITQSVRERVAADSGLLEWSALVLENSGWESGVIGAVASRLAQDYARPVFLMVPTVSGIVRGSARTFGDYNVHQTLQAVSDLLLNFGGHAGAAGFSLDEENLSAFRRRISNALNQQSVGVAAIEINAELDFHTATLELAHNLDQLAPYGNGNQRPKFVSRQLALASSAKIGSEGQHLRLRVRDESGIVKYIMWWNSADLPMPSGIFDLVYEMKPTYRDDQYELQMTLLDWQQVIAEDVIIGKPELIDCRTDFDLESIRAKESSLVIWSEGLSQRDSPGVPYSELASAEALLIYVAPYSHAILHKTIEKVKPHRIYIHAKTIPFDDPAQLTQGVLALLKQTMREPLKLQKIAERLGHSVETIKLLLNDLSSNISFEWINQTTILVEQVDLSSAINISEPLRRALAEAAAYRRYVGRVDLESLLE